MLNTSKCKETPPTIKQDTSLVMKHTVVLDVIYYTDKAYNRYRRVALMALDAACVTTSSFCDKSTSKVSRKDIIHQIELGVYENARGHCDRTGCLSDWSNPMFVNAYNNILYTTQQIIRKLPGVVARIESGDVDPTKLSTMQLHQLVPKYDSVRQMEDRRKKQYVKVKTTSDWPCPKCNAREATQVETQTRGMDEELTSKFQCIKCGWVWDSDEK